MAGGESMWKLMGGLLALPVLLVLWVQSFIRNYSKSVKIRE